jgi:ABC-type Fe3+-siderophore transport system permease subunit
MLTSIQIFVLYKLADPGTIQLIRSGVTLITALVMLFTLGTRIGKLQWMAIIMQVCVFSPLLGILY